MVDIQWYPGHMEKARRQMQESLKAVDAVIEVRDARIPAASRNPILNDLAKGKPRLIVLAKSDLADPVQTARWIQKLSEEDVICIAADLLNDSSVKTQLSAQIMKLTAAKRQKMIDRGIVHPRPMRAMIAGIPNVGKSTLINRIAGRKSAKTEDRPGVTRSLTWIHADPNLDLLDTPGVLWPKFSERKTGCLLAAEGAMNQQILEIEEIARETIAIIEPLYPGLLNREYETDAQDPAVMLKAIAAKRMLLKENGELDTKRAADVFLRELRKGKLGRLTLENAE